ncbi:response regulator transcription factor [Dictyobacter alpinus]|nr:response regulator [Dictyobacter alpinus]
MYEATGQRRILVVEDEMSIRQVLCFFLKHQGFEVMAASNGLDAIRIIPDFQPHLIVLDLIMQPGSGWDVLHWLRANRLLPHIPVLVMSALVQLQEQMHGFEEGALEYLTKPTQPSVIVERVRALLALSTEQRTMLQHKRMDEQRKTLKRLSSFEIDEFAY